MRWASALPSQLAGKNSRNPFLFVRLHYNQDVRTEEDLQQAVSKINTVRNEVAKIIVGQQDVVDGVLICLIAGGHVLLEGVPGLGKTTLLRTLGRVLHLKFSRIQ